MTTTITKIFNQDQYDALRTFVNEAEVRIASVYTIEGGSVFSRVHVEQSYTNGEHMLLKTTTLIDPSEINKLNILEFLNEVMEEGLAIKVVEKATQDILSFCFHTKESAHSAVSTFSLEIEYQK